MADYILNNKQLSTLKQNIEFQEKYNLALENWEKFTIEQKEYVVETFSFLYPDKVRNLNEASWLNTLGDIIGIFDPTGVVDFVNGISYIAQGDQLFGFLSLVSAVPYVGDFVAKPVMAAIRVGGPSAKGLKNVMNLAKAGDTVRASAELARISKTDGIIAKFVNGFGKMAGKLKEMILRSPGGIFKGFKNTILQWIELFEKGAAAGKPLRVYGQKLAKQLPTLTKAEQLNRLKALKEIAAETNFFRSYRTPNQVLSWKNIWGGLPQLMGRNKSVRALMRKSKWYLGFLDYLGVANFVGPEEFKKKVGDSEFERMLREYQKTTQSRTNFADEYGVDDSTSQGADSSSTSTSSQAQSGDPIQQMIQSLVLGRLKGSALGSI
jgi:hypothetical protein